ncbi:MAG: APC family permease [Deltaproteobacteria bacterium]
MSGSIVEETETRLRRTVGPFELTLYGLGSMLGSGIYALVGKAAGIVGNAVWLSFLAALCAALLTALSYASLGSRYPRAAGAAFVTDRAFRWPVLSFTVGLALVCSGMTSVATQSRVFATNLAALAGWQTTPVEVLALGFLLIMAGIVFRGIRESMWVNIVCTLVEVSGLLIVIAVGFSYWGSVDYFETPAETQDANTLLLILQGSILTFFAFIGFEDTYNVAEEVKNPETTIPIALVSAMLLATALYIAVAISAVSVVPHQELAKAPAPLAAVMQKAAPTFPATVLVAITMFAVANTALVNYVTASRMLYGMSSQGLLPAAVGRIHRTRQTPHVAILILFALLAPLMLSAGISELASATVLLLLFAFAVVNASLFVLKRRPGEPPGRFEVPTFVPALGFVFCLVLIAVRILTGNLIAPLIAGILIAGILAIYVFAARNQTNAPPA